MWEERVAEMNYQEAKTWAKNVTTRLQGLVVDTADAYYTLEERKASLLRTLVEAQAGGAWKLLGWRSWDEYWANEFSEAKLFTSIEERNDIIVHLKKNGFSQRAIAPMVGVNVSTVSRTIAKDAKNIRLLHDATVGLDGDSSESVDSGEDSTSDQFDQKIKAMDGREIREPRTEEELAKDFAQYSGLTVLDGLTQKQVSEQLGVPTSTVSDVLSHAADYPQFDLWFVQASRMVHGEGISMGAVAERLRMAPKAVEWLLSKEGHNDKTLLEHIIQFTSFKTWVDDHQQSLILIDDKPATQNEIATMLGVSQAMVSQQLDSWRKATLVPKTATHDKKDVIPVSLTDNHDNSLYIGMDVPAAQESAKGLDDEYFNGAMVNDQPRSAANWFELEAGTVLDVDPAEEFSAGLVYNQAMKAARHYFPHMATIFNLLLTHAEITDGLTRPQFAQEFSILLNVFHNGWKPLMTSPAVQTDEVKDYILTYWEKLMAHLRDIAPVVDQIVVQQDLVTRKQTGIAEQTTEKFFLSRHELNKNRVDLKPATTTESKSEEQA